MSTPSTETNILGKNLRMILNSQHHIQYETDLKGIQTDENLMDNPNVDTYERRGWGTDGISYKEQTFSDQPWTMGFEYQELVNRIQAMMRDVDPVYIESEDTSAELTGVDTSINLDANIDIFINQTDRTNTNYVKSICYLNSDNNMESQTAPHTGSGATTISGTADRGIKYNKPVFFEGWGRLGCAVTPAGTPDATTTTASGTIWIRNTTATDVARKCRCTGGVITHSTPSANPRIDAIVAYETEGNDYHLGIVAVEGAENASPTAPSDSDIQTAIDSAAFTNARWHRIANIAVEVTGPTIAASDITMATATTFTYAKVPLALSSTIKSNSYYVFDYPIYVKIGGVYKDNTSGVTTDNATNLVLAVATGNLVEVLYFVAPAAIWDATSPQ